jgi:hypothetical protein
MSQTSDGGAPGQQPEAPAGQHQQEPGSPAAPPAPQPRRPAWRRPSVLIPVVGAAAVAVAAAVLWSGSASGPYTSLPAACAVVPAATLAAYAPDATAAPQHDQPLVGCDWTTNTSQGSRELEVWVVIYDSSEGGSKTARQDFALNVREKPPSASPPLKIAVTRKSVTGLGDQAAAQIDQVRTPPTPPLPLVILNVWSRNADLTVTYDISSGGTDPLPTGPQMLSDTIAIARAVLAVLANHA